MAVFLSTKSRQAQSKLLFHKATILGHAFREEIFQHPRLLADVDFDGIHKAWT